MSVASRRRYCPEFFAPSISAEPRPAGAQAVVGASWAFKNGIDACIGPGARSRSPSGGRQKTLPSACANSSMFIIPMPRASGSCKTSCRPTRLVPFMRHSRPPKLGEFCAAWSSTTPQACQLAQHGRDRDRRAARPVPGPSNRRPQAPHQRNRRKGTTTKRRQRPHQMDVHNRKSPRQNGPRLSRPIQRVIITVLRY